MAQAVQKDAPGAPGHQAPLAGAGDAGKRETARGPRGYAALPPRGDPREDSGHSAPRRAARGGGSSVPPGQPATANLHRSARNRRPRRHEIGWPRPLRANLKHHQPEHRPVVPEIWIGSGRRGGALRDRVPCVDRSRLDGGIGRLPQRRGRRAAPTILRAAWGLAGVLRHGCRGPAGKRAAPVDVLFGAPPGGGTASHRAVSYRRGTEYPAVRDHSHALQRPDRSRSKAALCRRLASVVAGGTRVINSPGPGRRWGADLRPRSGIRLHGVGRAGVRGHARPVPEPDGGGHPAARRCPVSRVTCDQGRVPRPRPPAG